MLDIKFIRENPEKVKEGCEKKQVRVDIERLLETDKKRRGTLRALEDMAAQKNNASKIIAETKDEKEKNKLILEMRELDKNSDRLNEKFRTLDKKFNDLISQVSNMPADDAPVGKDERDNVVIKEVGEKPKFDFKTKDHLELGKVLDLIDFERGAKVAGSNFYYLKNEAALLELALINYTFDILIKEKFIPVITPDLAREKFYTGTGYLPKGPEAQTYEIKESDLGLVATSEITLAGLHADEVLKEADLPKKYAGFSHCFRQEAGAYGKYSKGLYRIHQFSKVEMYVYCLPEESEKMHQYLLSLEEKIFQGFKIPYRIIEMCTGDLGTQAAKKYDLEAWMPGRGDWGEITSTSNTTDYQARRLNIRYKSKNGLKYAHTLNGTAIAVPRVIIAILENYQQKDGSIKVPEVLQKYTGFREIKY